MKSNIITEELEKRIIAVAYGEASFFERQKIKKIVSKNEAAKKLLEKYSRTAVRVHAISKEKFLGTVDTKKEDSKAKSIIEDIYIVFISRPLVTTATTLLLLFAIVFSVISNRKISYDGYTFSEVNQARMESKEALLIVSNIFNRTEHQVRNNILIDEVSKPINKGINSINKLFKEK